MTTTLAKSREIIEVGGTSIEVERHGSGRPLVLLPGEDGFEASCQALDELARDFEVLTIWPPGFGNSSRPDWISSVDDMAYIFLDVLQALGLRDVPMIGCSLGGWLAAEIATKDDSLLSRLVLVAPLGVKLGGPTDRDIQDIWCLLPNKVAELKWFDPAKGKRDFKSMSDDALTIIARNSESLARFCWQPYMHNPKLKHRLHRISIPTLMVWGDSDHLVRPGYGRDYCDLIPGARMAVIPAAGHLPHIEQPNAFLAEVKKFLR